MAGNFRNEINLSDNYRIITSSSSKGTQTKYFYNNVWYKLDTVGNESVSETLVSKLLQCSNLANICDYELCQVNDKPACCSNNFLPKNAKLITLEFLHFIYKRKSLTDFIVTLPLDERFNYVCNFVKTYTGIIFDKYLSIMLWLDFLILNVDRHFDNIALIKYENDFYTLPPIFDNGMSLGANWQITPPDLDIETVITSSFSRTLCGSFLNQVKGLDCLLKIDFDRFRPILSNFNQRNAKVLEHQIDLLYKHFE